MGRFAKTALAAALSALACSCSEAPAPLSGVSTFRVVVTSVNSNEVLPTIDNPLPANRGETEDAWAFTIDARDPYGQPQAFEGMVRVSVEPGAVNALVGEGIEGRNILVKGGKASGTAMVTAVYGHARLKVEDIGYLPAEPGTSATCSNGRDDDRDGFLDFPADPGCAFANDESETAGTFMAGVSKPIEYDLPSIVDIQGEGSASPFPYEGMEVNTSGLHDVIVTRISSDGFYVTDLGEKDKGFNSIFAFNFSTPAKMRVCDRLTYLAGTVNEFFGFTELSFPSFRLSYPHEGDPCGVPEPTVLTPQILADPAKMESLESALVRIEGFRISSKFGPKPALKNIFKEDQSNCDFNGDGQVDFESDEEGSCSNVCAKDVACTEWTSFSARGNYKVSSPNGQMIQIQTGTVPLFDPVAHKGEIIDAVTGTMRNFSGGSLNWTIETRCPDDLACIIEGVCVLAAMSSETACVRLRSIDDNDQGTN